MALDTPVKNLGGVYKRYASALEKLGIIKLKDFLYHIPFRYDDFSLVSEIDKVQPGETITIQGEITEIKNQYTRRWRNLQKALVKDRTGYIEVIWFNQPFIPKIISKGDKISLSGKVKEDYGKKTLLSPQYEVLKGETLHTGRLVPVYPETRGISSKWIRSQVDKLLKEDLDIEDLIPNDMVNKNKLLKLDDAIRKVHFPKDLDEAQLAKKRLSFDELFLIQLKVQTKKAEWKKITASHVFQIEKFGKEIENFLDSLPFEFTNAQKKAIEDIFIDLKSQKPMNRLLEGEVGSGKTVVAAVAMYISYLNGYQSVLMAPTEILATQHFQTIENLLKILGLKIALVTSGKKIQNEDFDILIGTHALLFNKIEYENVGLVVIDEQQRFGVKQRGIARGKGNSPHLLSMTATPIPRTVALTIYGDLDLTLIDEMPKERKLVKTWLVNEEKRENAYKWIEKEIKENKSQAFIICPFIEESETLTTVKAATKEFERLKKNIFPKLKLALLHGKMKSKDKDKILEDFKNKKYHILVSTPVVEVGIDIPNATVMLIEASERFGLAQLHQLRGRVGRGEKQSYCLLFTEAKNEKTLLRIRGMEKIHIGAELAELDLRLRGPGEIYGTSQHGIPKLKVASFSDFPLIEKTKKEAEKILPDLKKYPKLEKKVKEEDLSQISPD